MMTLKLAFTDSAVNRISVLISILCTCTDEDIWAERLNQRKLNPLPNQLITDIAEIKRHYKTIDFGTLNGELILDTVSESKVLIDRVSNYID